MDLEIELWQKAAEWVHRQYGWCESMQECQKEVVVGFRYRDLLSVIDILVIEEVHDLISVHGLKAQFRDVESLLCLRRGLGRL